MWWILHLVMLVWYLLVLSVMLLGVFKIYKMSVLPPPHSTEAPSDPQTGVTILRPLKGLDLDLYQCLRSCFDQKYNFEMIFCIAEDNDPAISVAERLIAEFPDADAKIMIGDDNYGPNPKINNLAKGYKAAKYDIVWVLDSNVVCSPLTMPQALSIFSQDPKCQLVHSLPTGVHENNNAWGGMLEEMYLLTAHSKFYTGINEVGIAPCVCGKSNFYRRSDVDKATKSSPGEGIRAFASYISEDQLIAEALWAQGGRTRLVNQPVVQPLGAAKISVFALRRIRWLRVRKYMVITATIAETTTESVVAGLIGAFAISRLRGLAFSWILLAIHMTVWCAVDYYNFHNILKFKQFGESGLRASFTKFKEHRSLIQWLLVWLTRELMCLPIWIVAMCGSSIIWRNKPFRIRRDLVAEEIIE